MKNINNDDPAGPTYTITCPGCNIKITVYDRSFWGKGKKCPKCKKTIEPIPYSKGKVRFRYG